MNDLRRILLHFIPLLLLSISLLMLGDGLGAALYIPKRGNLLKERFCRTDFPELAGKGVFSIAEDSTGTLWFGVNSGIFRYDGWRWKLFSSQHGLPEELPQAIRVDAAGKIYSLFENHGIYALADTIWSPILLPFDSTAVFYDLLTVGRDSLWAATNRGALFYDGRSTLVVTADGVFEHTPSANSALAAAESLSDIYDVYQDRNGDLWLIQASPKDDQIIRIPDWRKNLKNPVLWRRYSPVAFGHLLGTRPKLLQTSDGTYWIYSYSEEIGLYHFKTPDGAWSYVNLNSMGGNNVVLSALETHDRTLWFGGNGYLYAFNDGSLEVFSPELLDLPIMPLRILQARNGALWLVGLNVAAYRIDYVGEKWQVLEDLHYQCADPLGRRFFINSDGRIVIRNADRRMSYGSADGAMDMPLTVVCDPAGGVWAAGSHRGVAAVSRLEGERWRTDTFPDLAWSIGHLSALALEDGQMWFGSIGDPSGRFRGGCVIYELQDGIYRHRRIVSPTGDFNRINSLTVIGRQIWAGATYLKSFDGGDWQPIAEPKELQKGWIDHVMGASDGSLWVAKGGVGVYHLQGEHAHRYSQENGLPSNMVTFLLETPRGIYAASEKGVSLFDGSSWITHALPKEIAIPRESGTLRYDPDGSLWINLTPREWYFRALKPARRAYSGSFRTIRYRADDLPPTTEITFYQPKMAMPANQYISWQGYDPWGATAANELSFSHSLDNGEWSPFTTATFIQMLNMKHGAHTFQVRARDRDGNVDPIPAQISFTVIPPIWRQPWFLLLVIAFSVAIIALLIILSMKNKKLAAAKKEIERAASFQERFFLNISHEFRTPLTMILAPISAIFDRENGITESIGRQLHTIRHHAHYLLRLVNQLLDLSKLESGKYHLRVVEGELVEVVRRIIALFDWFAKEHHIEYRLVCAHERLSGCFDLEKLEDVLTNLIGNAFKFTPDGGSITVNLTARSLPADGAVGKSVSARGGQKTQTERYDWVEIRVSDTGIGIPSERLPHIFDRFYTVEHPGGLYYDSIGVGLDFTREIVELHHGSICVESTVGAGTTFTVLFPIDCRLFDETEKTFGKAEIASLQLSAEKIREIKEERRKLPAQHLVATLEATEKRAKGASVLIVEDHAEIRRLLAEFFKANYEIFQAEDGLNGFETATAVLPDLVITDVMMPNMDGIELTRRLKSNPMTSHIPVILLTMKDKISHRIEGFDIGADAYIAKPFEMEELAAVLRNLIATRRRLQEKFRQEIVVQPNDVTINNVDAEFLATCIRIVEAHIGDQNFHVDQFCRELGMSRTPAFQKIKSISGFTPNEFILHIRLKRAAQLLTGSTMNISEIAYSLGFSDHAHFTRHFRDAFGCPPKEFRKRQA